MTGGNRYGRTRYQEQLIDIANVIVLTYFIFLHKPMTTIITMTLCNEMAHPKKSVSSEKNQFSRNRVDKKQFCQTKMKCKLNDDSIDRPQYVYARTRMHQCDVVISFNC